MSIRKGKAPDKWYLNIYRDGRHYSMPFTGTEAEALAFEQELRGARPSECSRLIELQPAYLQWAELNRAPRTAGFIRNALRHIMRHMGNVPVSILSNAHYENYKAARLKESIPGKGTTARVTINGELKTLVGMLRYHAKQGTLVMPTRLPELFTARQCSQDTRKIEILTPEELQAIFSHATDGLLTLVMLLFWGGLRRSEATQLLWSEVDLEQRVMLVSGKTGKRFQAIPEPLYDYLCNRDATGYVVATRTGKRLANPQTQLNRLASRAGIAKRLTCHTFRHTFATSLAIQGATANQLMHSLGHSTLAMSARYVHLSQAHVAKNSKLLEAYVNQ